MPDLIFGETFKDSGYGHIAIRCCRCSTHIWMDKPKTNEDLVDAAKKAGWKITEDKILCTKKHRGPDGKFT